MSQKIYIEQRKPPPLWWHSSMLAKPDHGASYAIDQQPLEAGGQEAEYQCLPAESVDSSFRLEQDRLEEIAEVNTQWEVENFNRIYIPEIRRFDRTEGKNGRKRFVVLIETLISQVQ